MSTQKFTFSNNEVALKFTIDVNTLAKISPKLFGKDFDKKKGIILSNYIQKKLSLSIEGHMVDFEMVSAIQNKHFLNIYLNAPCYYQNNSQIQIKSDLFYEANSSFENRIIISNDKTQNKSYRLTKERNTIKIKI